MLRRLAPLLVLVSLVGAACTSEGLPGSYSDQDARAQTQFVEACEASLADEEQDDPASYCECAFYTVASDKSFAEFLALDEKLKNDPGSLTQEEQDLIRSVSLPCEFDASTINNSATSE